MGLLLEGHLEFTVGGVTRLLGPGDIWRIPGGVVHRVRAPKSPRSRSTFSIPFVKTTSESRQEIMPRVVVFGSSNTDMTVRVPRLPAPGQTDPGSTFTTTPGGKGANQAVAARRAGADVVFVTAVGNDDLGQQALELYQREGIDVSHVRDRPRGSASGVALIFVADDGENMIGVAPGANATSHSG